MLLKSKTAVITGCNKGIGKKILEVFSANGATVLFVQGILMKKNHRASNKSIDILVNNAATIHTSIFQMTPVKKIKRIIRS